MLRARISTILTFLQQTSPAAGPALVRSFTSLLTTQVNTEAMRKDSETPDGVRSYDPEFSYGIPYIFRIRCVPLTIPRSAGSFSS